MNVYIRGDVDDDDEQRRDIIKFVLCLFVREKTEKCIWWWHLKWVVVAGLVTWFFCVFFHISWWYEEKTIKLNENHMHISIKCAYEHENIWISTHNYKILIILTQCIIFYGQYRNFIKIMMNIHFYVSFTFMNFVLISCFI